MQKESKVLINVPYYVLKVYQEHTNNLAISYFNERKYHENIRLDGISLGTMQYPGNLTAQYARLESSRFFPNGGLTDESCRELIEKGYYEYDGGYSWGIYLMDSEKWKEVKNRLDYLLSETYKKRREDEDYSEWKLDVPRFMKRFQQEKIEKNKNVQYKLKEDVTEEDLLKAGYAISEKGYAFKRVGVNQIYINLSHIENDFVGKRRHVLEMDSRYDLDEDLITKEMLLGLFEKVTE